MAFLYRTECGTCKTELEFQAEMDDDHDIYMFVEPCKVCMENAEQKGLKEGYRRYKGKGGDIDAEGKSDP